jgi:hypothetical protein
MQNRVRECFDYLRRTDKSTIWHVIDASPSIDEVQESIFEIVRDVIDQVQSGKPVNKLWQEGEFVMSNREKESKEAGE